MLNKEYKSLLIKITMFSGKDVLGESDPNDITLPEFPFEEGQSPFRFY